MTRVPRVVGWWQTAPETVKFGQITETSDYRAAAIS